jgi:hypothetical protein
MTFFLLYYLTCALAVTKQLSHRNRASQHVSSPGDAGIQRWGHDEAAMQAGKPSKAGKPCNVVALWVLAFAGMTHVCGAPPCSGVGSHSLRPSVIPWRQPRTGMRFDNRYCWIVVFDRARIVRVRAYLDTAMVVRLFKENPIT